MISPSERRRVEIVSVLVDFPLLKDSVVSSRFLSARIRLFSAGELASWLVSESPVPWESIPSLDDSTVPTVPAVPDSEADCRDLREVSADSGPGLSA